MTGEHAINLLHNSKPKDNNAYSIILNEALDMAIKALEEQESCADCISRESALKTLDNMDNILDEDRTGEYYKKLLKECLEVLPPVTPHQKTGHWINGDDKCPCCGKSKFEDLDADIWADWQPKFCPNCGAKMEAEK